MLANNADATVSLVSAVVIVLTRMKGFKAGALPLQCIIYDFE